METFKEKNAPLRQPEAAEAERDEALFHSLQKRKQAKKRRTTRRVIILLLTAAVCLTGGVIYLRRRVTHSLVSNSDVSSAQARRGSISTTVSGSGTLANVDEEEITVPYGVVIDEVLVSISIDELDILTLHVGDAAKVTVDALPGHVFDGVVTGVNTGRSNSGGNSKYLAEVTLPMDEDMLIGMNASCLITIETLRDVLTVPAAAVSDEASGPVIYTGIGRDGQTLSEPVPARLGLSDGETVEIVSGLSEGDTVWYSTYDTPEYSVSRSRNGGISLGRMFGGPGGRRL